MRRSPAPPLLALALAAALPLRASAAPALVAAFDDPAGDATGPGSYVPPGDTQFMDGDFDLRRFAVFTDGDDVIFEVTLGAPIRQPDETHRTSSTSISLWNGITLQNVDIYVDSVPTPGSGFSVCIPGRRVGFADGRTWETAVVLTPQPDAARAVVDQALGKAASHVVFAERLRFRGRTLVARVPAALLGGTPRKDWGFSVHVSGARWERTFGVVDRLRGAPRDPDAFTMPVTTTREAWAFGGAPPGELHPRVVDVLLPPGVDQKAVLGSFDAATKTYARVPFVYGEPPPTAAAPSPAAVVSGGLAGPAAAAPGALTLSVADLAEDLVTLSGSIDGLAPLRIGEVLGPDGAPVARVVVVQVLPGGAVAKAVDGRERIARGAKVRFEEPAKR